MIWLTKKGFSKLNLATSWNPQKGPRKIPDSWLPRNCEYKMKCYHFILLLLILTCDPKIPLKNGFYSKTLQKVSPH